MENVKDLYDELHIIKNDLKFQLGFEHIDWDYFVETANRAKIIENKIDKDTD